ncbi:uncharacterized protein LOC128327346 [Hemicordylus capensis]|uniref:uncharacterized protein LOC128327346 n=1 Tax=Hemicordylus capensis TaxID=884348 RepID=UPI0023048878|nr:uncharacterized protein LOC128327346 [Hemicordylus capensis]
MQAWMVLARTRSRSRPFQSSESRAVPLLPPRPLVALQQLLQMAARQFWRESWEPLLFQAAFLPRTVRELAQQKKDRSGKSSSPALQIQRSTLSIQSTAVWSLLNPKNFHQGAGTCDCTSKTTGSSCFLLSQRPAFKVSLGTACHKRPSSNSSHIRTTRIPSKCRKKSPATFHQDAISGRPNRHTKGLSLPTRRPDQEPQGRDMGGAECLSSQAPVVGTSPRPNGGHVGRSTVGQISSATATMVPSNIQGTHFEESQHNHPRSPGHTNVPAVVAPGFQHSKRQGVPRPGPDSDHDRCQQDWLGGAHCHHRTAQGWWSQAESVHSINWLELRAIRLALLAFQDLITSSHMLIRTDNTTAKAHIDRGGPGFDLFKWKHH